MKIDIDTIPLTDLNERLSKMIDCFKDNINSRNYYPISSWEDCGYLMDVFKIVRKFDEFGIHHAKIGKWVASDKDERVAICRVVMKKVFNSEEIEI